MAYQAPCPIMYGRLFLLDEAAGALSDRSPSSGPEVKNALFSVSHTSSLRDA
jgi:hypothetical protein